MGKVQEYLHCDKEVGDLEVMDLLGLKAFIEESISRVPNGLIGDSRISFDSDENTFDVYYKRGESDFEVRQREVKCKKYDIRRLEKRIARDKKELERLRE